MMTLDSNPIMIDMNFFS